MLLLGTTAATSAGAAAGATESLFPVLLSGCSWTEEHHRLEQRKLTFFLEISKPEKQDRQFNHCEKRYPMNALAAIAYVACG